MADDKSKVWGTGRRKAVPDTFSLRTTEGQLAALECAVIAYTSGEIDLEQIDVINKVINTARQLTAGKGAGEVVTPPASKSGGPAGVTAAGPFSLHLGGSKG